MLMNLRCWSLAFLAACLFLSNATAGRLGDRFRDLTHNKGFGRKRLESRSAAAAETHTNASSPYRFLTKQTQPFKVDSLPDIPFDIGEMYAGLIPISEHNKSRALYYVFQPTVGAPVDEITIWLNGGPGCSSLEGFFQENGRFLWRLGQYSPTINPYSWVNLTNVLWVEQPVGTGFSIGEVTAKNEEDVAKDFVDWFHNFGRTFDIKNFKIFVAGESYAGRYVPYISAAMLDKNDTQNFNLKGALAYDPCIGSYGYTQEEVVAVPFVVENNNIIGLNQSFIAQLEEAHETCGYADYLDKYLTFPASGVQPPKYFNYSTEGDCDLFGAAINAAFNPNPCFNVYQIAGLCPLLSDPLGFPTDLVYSYPGLPVYFNREDVKKAMHAPEDVEWSECSAGAVFLGNGGPEDGGDTSPDPTQHVLPRVIEATNRVLISNADLDMIIITNGTLLAIQNMTWNGALGFQSAPKEPIVIDLPDLEYGPLFEQNFGAAFEDPQGTMGVQHFERGLMWAETFLSGHMQPQFQPRTSYRHLQWLLGHIETL